MQTKKKPNLKLIIGGAVILAAVIYLIISSTMANANYFMTVSELLTQKQELAGKNIRMSGAIIGSTIVYDSQKMDLTFEVAEIPGDYKEIDRRGGLAKVLYEAVNDPSLPRMTIHYLGPKPDLMKDEAQAIVTGSLDQNGVFQATELLMKCPSKYESSVPDQSK
ncbi:MAG TPA: cytochrome c maturation protein CcmE [Anaerolineaceae bacterium]|nr:cytochrome c maturation protein CcmE [Anaerolineaceae bacterium]